MSVIEMMKRISVGVGLGVTLLAACAAPEPPSTVAESQPTTEVLPAEPRAGDVGGQLLAEVTVAPSHTLSFYQGSNGVIGLKESAPEGQEQVSEDDVRRFTPVEIYERMAKTTNAPTAPEPLRSAQDRLAAAPLSDDLAAAASTTRPMNSRPKCGKHAQPICWNANNPCPSVANGRVIDGWCYACGFQGGPCCLGNEREDGTASFFGCLGMMSSCYAGTYPSGYCGSWTAAPQNWRFWRAIGTSP